MSTTVFDDPAMDNDVMTGSAQHDGIRLSERQRAEFDRDGSFVVRDAIPQELLVRLDEAMNRVYVHE